MSPRNEELAVMKNDCLQVIRFFFTYIMFIYMYVCHNYIICKCPKAKCIAEKSQLCIETCYLGTNGTCFN